MKPITFPEKNVVWAENQKEYLPLPAYTDDKETISCWRLSLWERVVVLFTGRMWLRLSNFQQSLQPQHLSVFSPFAPPSSRLHTPPVQKEGRVVGVGYKLEESN